MASSECRAYGWSTYVLVECSVCVIRTANEANKERALTNFRASSEGLVKEASEVHLCAVEHVRSE
jgi:hypothetical protein